MSKSEELQTLCTGLAASFQQGYWQCDDEFLQLTGLDKDAITKTLSHYASSSRWMDVLVTEIAVTVVAKAGAEGGLVKDWKTQTNLWIERSFSEAAKETSIVPPRPYLHTKGMLLADSVLKRFGFQSASAVVYSGSRVTCETCGRTYSTRLNRCPGCVDREREAKRMQEKRAAELRDAEWRALVSLPIGNCDDTKVCWSEASEVKYCHGGSGGAVIVKFPNGAVCIKGARYTPDELFAQKLACLLDVRVAASRVVQASSEEAAEICRALANAEPVDAETGSHRRLSPPFTLLQFVDGVSMMGLPAHQYLKSVQTESADGALWLQMGRLMAFDTLINNFDRLPLAWSNDGNLGNVMLGSSLGLVVGIDQGVAPIYNATGFSAYLERVRSVVREARDGTGVAFAAVSKATNTNTAIDLSTSEIALLRSGALTLFREIAERVDSGEIHEQLADVCMRVRATMLDGECGGDSLNATQPFSDLVLRVAHGIHEELMSNDDQEFKQRCESEIRTLL